MVCAALSAIGHNDWSSLDNMLEWILHSVNVKFYFSCYFKFDLQHFSSVNYFVHCACTVQSSASSPTNYFQYSPYTLKNFNVLLQLPLHIYVCVCVCVCVCMCIYDTSHIIDHPALISLLDVLRTDRMGSYYTKV